MSDDARSRDEAPASTAGERRSFHRVPLQTEVSLESDSQFFAGFTGDISGGGIFVSTYTAVPLGSEVAVEFTLPTGVISARGIVRWLREASDGASPGIGIRFESLSPADEAAIRSFCAQREPLFYDDE